MFPKLTRELRFSSPPHRVHMGPSSEATVYDIQVVVVLLPREVFSEVSGVFAFQARGGRRERCGSGR